MSMAQEAGFSALLPSAYAQSAIIPQKIAEYLLERLAYLPLTPHCIVDVGCGTGHLLPLLRERYPHALLIGIDRVFPFLHYAPADYLRVCADALCLPLRPASVDMVVANFLLPWCEPAQSLLLQLRDLLKPDGLLLLSTFGPDTCREIGAIPACVDMHHLGDLVHDMGWRDPVLDTQHITLRYRESATLRTDLLQQGWGYWFSAGQIAQAEAEQLTFEVITLQAWAPATVSAAAEMVSFPVEKIGRRKG